jgi:hypothetical protein
MNADTKKTHTAKIANPAPERDMTTNAKSSPNYDLTVYTHNGSTLFSNLDSTEVPKYAALALELYRTPIAITVRVSDLRNWNDKYANTLGIGLAREMMGTDTMRTPQSDEDIQRTVQHFFYE